ncbi:MAG: valine--tRNA ligase [Clostridia bacterium]|nr:valine--tRNA ligase [Clostridia bacterium]
MENKMTGADMETRFNPQAIEADLYKAWEEADAFVAHREDGKKPFTIVMPPPNITGQLHMGHAMDCILQDAPIRYHRMKGDPTLWLPGTDHAAIATEVKIVDAMRKEGLTKQGIGREAFLERAWNWKKEYGGRIVHQQRKMGVSCDWSRERFTMDDGCSKAVREVFVRLYEKDLIYRGKRMINWCPACRSALSDAEVVYKDQASHLWHIRYPGADGSEGVIVATTRPETMLGDTGVAVNPADERYTNLVGKKVVLPLMNKEIPVVADDYVEMDFGTGAVKMTPAHDPNDFEVAQRHNLEIITVTNDDGTMNENAGRFAGMDPMECRKAVVEELEKLGLLVKIEDYNHNVGFCYRHETTPAEPRLSEQWFVKMKPLAEPAIAAVREGKTKFVPDRFSKIYYNWMENIRDWCISRQLWWGHRIPAWYCDDCGEMIVSRVDPSACPKCGGKLRQDEDVLDTWFSSALWPFSTLGWPEQTEDLKYFYPTSMLVTGYDIIFFWVARMIFSGIENMGETPFETVLIHGLVRDEQGRKMSKSLGNGVDPLEVIEEYGADALRFSLVMGVSPGNDTRYSRDKVESARNFANKVWNASRFVLMNVSERKEFDPSKLETADKWILSRLQEAIRDVSDHMEDGDFGLAATKIYDFAWGEFCDWYIELSKSRLLGEDGESKDTVKAVLLYVLENLLKLLHPFMPFLTEQVYKYLPDTEGFLMLQKWPEYCEGFLFSEDEQKMQGIMEIIRTIRNLRSEMNVAPSKRTRLMLLAADGWKDTLTGGDGYFRRLAGASETVMLNNRNEVKEKTVSAVTAAGELFIPLGDLVDFEKEIARLGKELENLQKEMNRSRGMLNNQGFIAKAPAQLVQQERDKLEAAEAKAKALENRIAELKENA